MSDDMAGPPAAGPVKLYVPLEIREARAAPAVRRNGMPESKPYVYGQAAARRQRQVALILARVREQLGAEE